MSDAAELNCDRFVIAKRVSKNMQEEQYQIIITMYKPEA